MFIRFRIFARELQLTSRPVFTVLVLLLVGERTGIAQQSALNLPSSSYWNLLKECTQKAELRNQLGITSQQLDELKSLYRDNPLRAEFEQCLTKLRLEQARPPVSLETLTGLAWLLLDERATEELSNILTAEQLADLRPAFFRVRYRVAISVFTDLEVRQLIGLTVEEQRELNDCISRESNAFFELSRKMRVRRASPVTEAFSPVVREQFDKFAGTGSSEILAQEITAIPFTRNANVTSAYLSFIFASKIHQEALGLSQQQMRLLRDVAEKFSNSARHLQPGEDPRSRDIRITIERIKKAGAEAKAAVDEILTSDQRLRLSQLMSYTEFLSDYSGIYRSANLKKYLGLTAEEVAHLRVVVEKQKELLQNDLDGLNRTIFERLANEIPAVRRKQLLRLFPDGWATFSRF